MSHMNTSRAEWMGEPRFDDDHPSTKMLEISDAFSEATNDSLVVIDNLGAVDLQHANEAWRHGLASSLERDLEHVTKLYRAAIALARTLNAEEEQA